MPIEQRFQINRHQMIRDTRPAMQRWAETWRSPTMQMSVFGMMGGALALSREIGVYAPAVFLGAGLYFLWLMSSQVSLPLKLPAWAEGVKDANNKGGGRSGKAEGILFIGNEEPSGHELWLTNSDARTHILYLGTTGAGKTEGLKSLVSNAMTWGSGFVYVDGKADTDLWASLYALARRFGRDDDLLILNYMQGNSDDGASSNSLNPFATGSASYLTNLMVSLMDEAGGDNAMWKGRAISLLSVIMPILTYQRDRQGLLLDVDVIAMALELPEVIKLGRNPQLPPHLRSGIDGYLKTLPGFNPDHFDDAGLPKPGANGQAPDVTGVSEQHGYLTMQFTRSLSSLGSDYGYIFKQQIADIDMIDVVLNRRLLVVLIPALEKSPDEAANLGKIIVGALKGMMGQTLGARVEGDWDGAIENKPTRAASPFMTIFDEVGYYTTPGMAVMAAQARSLGFSLVFAAQDLPAMEKRGKEEARSITANCNLKIFGKLEDSGETKEFAEKTLGEALVTETSGFSMQPGGLTQSYYDRLDASLQWRPKVRFSEIKAQKEGEVHLSWGSKVCGAKMFYAAPKKVKALRVHRFLQVKPETERGKRDPKLEALIEKLRDKGWTAAGAAPEAPILPEIAALAKGFAFGSLTDNGGRQAGALAVAQLSAKLNPPKPAAATPPATVGAAPAIAGAAVLADAAAPPPVPTRTWADVMGAPLGEAPPELLVALGEPDEEEDGVVNAIRPASQAGGAALPESVVGALLRGTDDAVRRLADPSQSLPVPQATPLPRPVLPQPEPGQAPPPLRGPLERPAGVGAQTAERPLVPVDGE